MGRGTGRTGTALVGFEHGHCDSHAQVTMPGPVQAGRSPWEGSSLSYGHGRKVWS